MPQSIPSTYLGLATPPWNVYEPPNGIPGGDTTFKQRMAYVADLGVQTIRFDCWTAVNGTGTSRLAEMDNMVNDAISVGKVQGVVLTFTDRSGQSSSFTGSQGIAGAVTWALQRWHGKILAVCIGNELNCGNVDPNYSGDTVGGIAPAGTPANYAAQLKAAYDAARSTDPNVPVLLGALAAHDTDHDGGGIRPDTFLDGVLNEFNSGRSLGADGQYPFDGIDYHPYEQQANPTTDPATTTGSQTGGINGYVLISGKLALYNVPAAKRIIHTTEFGYQQASETTPFTPWPNYTTNVPGLNGFARSMIRAHRSFNQNSTTTGMFCWFTLSGNQSTDPAGWSCGLFSTSDTGSSVSTMTRLPLYADLKAMVVAGGPLRVRGPSGVRASTVRDTGNANVNITVTATQAQAAQAIAGHLFTKTVHASETETVTVGRTVARTVKAAETESALVFRNVTRAVLATQTETVTVDARQGTRRNFNFTLTATQSQTVTVVATHPATVYAITVTASQPQLVAALAVFVLIAYQPPVQDLVPPVSLDPVEIQKNRLGYRLFRHYPTRSRGVNVYQYEDGTFHQTQPWEGTVWSWDGTTQTVTITPPQHTIAHTFFGGHVEDIPVSVRDELAAANNGQGQ